MKSNISSVDFGTIYNGQKAKLYKIERPEISMCVSDFGCIITNLLIKNKTSGYTDVVLGMETLNAYATSWGSFGAVIGRYANRIKGASFQLNGKQYQLTENSEGACLHGGFPAWGNVIWNAETFEKETESGIILSRDFLDGEQGFPGNLHVEVEYVIDDEKKLSMNYRAKTDKDTPISITNHSYFNLKGSGTVHDYLLQLDSEQFVKVDENNFPTGQLESVNGTKYDFLKERAVCHESGFMNYDICYVTKAMNKENGLPLSGSPLVQIASVTEPSTGRKMKVSTNQEGFQLYAANYVKYVPGKDGRWYMPYQALCIETQSFPDSPNQKSFPAVILHPGELYDAHTVYAFSNF